MKRIGFFFFGLFFYIISITSCSSEPDSSKKTNRADAFVKIENESKSLFTKKLRINNYKSSVAKAEDLKASLKKNATYSGYGSSKPKKLESKEKNGDTPIKNTKKVNFNSTSNKTAVFSAYSTN
mgnify:CR=1 FL=1